MMEFDLKTAIPALLLILIAVFCLILLVRAILSFLLNKAYERYLAIKEVGKKLLPISRKKFLKEDEELSRKKSEVPRAHSEVKAEKRANKPAEQSGSYELMESDEQEETKELNQINIVDIVKPVGFWTSMILGQKLTYLIQSAQTLNKRGDKGFWASMIEAKENEAGKQHSRGR